MTRESILVVDDEPGVRSMLEAILKDEGYGVTAVGTGEDGVAAAARRPFDAMLLDVWLPGIDGIETLSRIKAQGIDAEIVMISGHSTIETAVKATKLGAFDFVEKPLSLEKTLLVLRNALRQRRLEKRNRSLLDQLTRDTEILGDSEAARRVRREASAAAMPGPRSATSTRSDPAPDHGRATILIVPASPTAETALSIRLISARRSCSGSTRTTPSAGSTRTSHVTPGWTA